jgi:hypothetical protein
VIPYADAFDVSTEREPYRSILSRQVVPALLMALAADGLDVLVSRDLRSKTEYNRLHADDPLLTRVSIADPLCQPQATERDVICCYLQHGGDLVGSLVLRLLWCEPSFGAGLEDLSLLYHDPATMAGEDDFVICRPAIAWDTLKAVHCAMMLGGHVRRDFRKTIAYDGLWRLARILALTSWRWSYTISLLEEAVARKIGFSLYGHQHGSPGVLICHREERHSYLLYVSERNYLRGILCRPETGDLSRRVGDLTIAELRQAQTRRSTLRAAGKNGSSNGYALIHEDATTPRRDDHAQTQ